MLTKTMTVTGVLALCLVALNITHTVGQEDKADTKPMPAPAATRPADSTAKLQLRTDLALEGTLVELETVKLNAIFGEVAVPTHAIVGIHFGETGKEPTTVIMRNGDTLTGQLGVSEIKIVSEWGQSTVNTSSIKSIVLGSDMQWSQSTSLDGQRWTLVKGTAPNTLPPGTTFYQNR
ncbi:MAG: hypothetical protein R3E01_28675 [Pirellulaceae bacterium]|nr:hypothetical protein [Planctomycetales bacterium]MCA9266567.1 hypothetical protein [Planctomycetales bacterium]